MDRFDDMRARVSSSGENSSGGGGGPFGVDVLVQATDNFSLGDTFVGTAVSGATPIASSVDSGVSATIYNGSADGTVLIKWNQVATTATQATFYIKTEENSYVEMNVDLPDLTGGSSGYGTSINEDGSICVINMRSFLIIIHINKDSKTGSAVRVELNEVNMSDYPYTASYGSFEVTPAYFNNIKVRGNYLFYGLAVNYVYNSKTQTAYATMFSRITASSLTNEYAIIPPSSSSYPPSVISGINEYGENKLVFVACGSAYLARVEISLGKVVSCNTVSGQFHFITRNGKYATRVKTIYKINQETGTATAIMTSTVSSEMNSYGMVDETGQYYRSRSNKIYSISDTSGSNGYGLVALNRYDDGYFDILNEGYITTGGKRVMLLPTSDAEYTIAHTISVSVAGDIYGVVTEAMAMGETKTALKIFNK